MSCDSFLGLDEFFDYKNQLIDDLLTNEDITKLLSEDGLTTISSKELICSQVFPCEYVPDTVEHGQTFICCEVDIKEVINKTYLVPVLYVWVFTHKSKVFLPSGGIRTDKISSKIAELINGSRMYGLGELSLQSAKRFSPIANYQGRILTFIAKDFNRLPTMTKKAPTNRKHT